MKLTRREAVSEYIRLIKNRINEPICRTRPGQTALHHIIPKKFIKCKRIVESKYNLVRLYEHEHLLAHYYLAIIFPDSPAIQTAFFMMSKLKHLPKVEDINAVADRYEQSRKKFVTSIQAKTYTERYGKNKAEDVKRKQKIAKLSHLIRIIPVDK